MIPGAGQRFGPYEIQARLGTGGMGHVFRAWDARLHREVALKLLQSDYAMPGMRERFLREARAASALNHPNICTIFDIGEQNGDPYLVMELLEGETLKDRILSRSLSVEEMVGVAREVGEALGAAHAKGIVHRDVKPANIFLMQRPNGGIQSKVLDFGLAKIEGGVLGARSSRSLELTAQGATVGTLAYMSPEQARGEPLDARSDLFSLGVVLYEMATQHIPFPGATSALVFVKLLNQAPEPVRDWNEAVPRDLERIILKLMAKERTARYQSALELDEALQKFTERGGGTAGWLRKAVTGSGLVGPAEPRRAAKKKEVQPEDEPQETWESRLPPRPTPQSSAPQVLRPVARIPRGDTTPRPAVGAGGTAPRQPGADSGTTSPAGASHPREAGSGAIPASVPGVLPADVLETDVLPTILAAAPAAAPVTVSEPVVSRRTVRSRLPHVTARSLAVGLVLLLAVGAIVLLIVNRGRFGQALLHPGDSVVVTEVENRTGDRSLDGSIAMGLQLALAQSGFMRMRSSEAYLTARANLAGDKPPRGVASIVAQQLGTRAYIFGSLTGTAAPYTLHLDLLDTGTNDILTGVEERVLSLQEMPSAIDRLAEALRASAGEGSDAIARSHIPLSREGTANLEALHSFAEAESTAYSGQTVQALRLYRQTAQLEPRFAQVQIRLAQLYEQLHAEVAASEAARTALAQVDAGSERTRAQAQFEYEVNVSGDLPRATAILRRVLETAPHDASAHASLAQVLRLQGRLAEALQMAQAAIAEEPYNGEAYAQAEAALIGLDRYEAAFQLDQTARQLGLARPGESLAAAFLGGRQEAMPEALAPYLSASPEYHPSWRYGLYLDSIGRTRDAVTLWRTGADQAGELPGMDSAAAFLLAQGALDRALFGDCATALTLAHLSDDQPQGPGALFNSGMANALCGDTARTAQIVDELTRAYPQSFVVNGFYLADLRAARALHDRDPAASLEALRPARQFDFISLTPYLRGLAHISLRQGQIGIVDLQTILAHRGITFLTGSDVYPAAELGLARAFADTGDQGNSAEAYRRFLNLWQSADPGQAPCVEARARLH